MCDWSGSSAPQENERSSVWGRRRGERPNPASNLVALPILLLFLGFPSHHREGYLWLCAAGTVTEYLQENATGASEVERYALPADATRISGQRIFSPDFAKHATKVPSIHEREYNSVKTQYKTMHNVLRANTEDHGERGRNFNVFKFGRKASWRMSGRHRRAVVNPSVPSSSASGWSVQPTSAPAELDVISPSLGYFTLVPDSTSTTAQIDSELETRYARLSRYLQTTPGVHAATTDPRPMGFTSRPFWHPSPSPLDSVSPHVTAVTSQPAPAPSTPRSTSPSASAVSPAAPIASTPNPWESTDEPAVSARYDSQNAEPSTFGPSAVNDVAASSYFRAETGTDRFTATPGDREAETDKISNAPSAEVSAAITTRIPNVPLGPPNVNARGVKAKQTQYTIVTNIRTEPSILIIMPCLVGLALLGLVAAGVKRCVVHWRLAHMVELTRDPEKPEQDKGYTIENPMVKSNWRSHIERQMEKTLQRVNKTESSSSNSNNSSSSSSSRNTNNNQDTKVRMEIAAISDGSLRRPARPLRRSASERIAPSRRKSIAIYRPSSHTECQCHCHCPLGGEEGRPLPNGSVATSTETTRL